MEDGEAVQERGGRSLQEQAKHEGGTEGGTQGVLMGGPKGGPKKRPKGRADHLDLNWFPILCRRRY